MALEQAADLLARLLYLISRVPILLGPTATGNHFPPADGDR
jgi:hypothetical protein